MARLCTRAARYSAVVFCRTVEVLLAISVLGFARTLEELL